MKIGDVATWVAAGIAFFSAVFTVWWPWHTRREPNFEYEKTPVVFERDDVANLLVACRLRAPEFFIALKNTGDGIAHSLKVSGGESNECVFFRPKSEGKPLFSPTLTSLKPDESITIIVLPTTSEEVTPTVELEYKEEPTRLKRSRVSKRLDVHTKLAARRPLTRLERIAAVHCLNEQAASFGKPPEEYIRFCGFDPADLEYENVSSLFH